MRDENNVVVTQDTGVAVATGETNRVRRPQLEIFEPTRDSDVDKETVSRGAATCPVTGFTTAVDRIREQLKRRGGGTADARLLAIVLSKPNQSGRYYRLPSDHDIAVLERLSHRVILDISESVLPIRPIPASRIVERSMSR